MVHRLIGEEVKVYKNLIVKIEIGSRRGIEAGVRWVSPMRLVDLDLC